MTSQAPSARTALIVGVTGLSGGTLARLLLAEGWTVYGLSRTPNTGLEGVRPVAADLLDPQALESALAEVTPTHVFITTWMRQETEAENIRVNSEMVRNVLEALAPKRSVQHVALVTGLKHYLGPFDAYATGEALPVTPLHEELPRLDLPNFYYAQEDEVYAAAERDGFSWSVHRPHTLIGLAVGNAMNLGTTLAVYASVCKATGRPFRWPGSGAQWSGLSDVTDARMLARQLLWAAETESAHDKAFNVVNGDVFRWSRLWGQIADWFGVEAAGFDGEVHPLQEELSGDAALWKTLATEHGLEEPNLDRLASAWHTDLDLSRPIEVMTDMARSRRLGFSAYQSTEDSFFDLFAQLRQERLIPG
ncbi:SDR family oxidoreductase [Deinococcus sp. UYEF24]